MSFFESKYDMPLCNHKEDITEHNIGYSVGITDDGVPFEAEMQVDEDIMTLTVIMPAIFDSKSKEEHDFDDRPQTNVIGFRNSKEMEDYGVLDFGMVDEGEEDDFDVTQRYVDYLIESEIISYASNIQNGSVQYRADINGNELIKILITMMSGDEVCAYTDLDFRPFDANHVSSKGSKVVSISDFKAWKR